MNLLANFGQGYDDVYGRLQQGNEQRAKMRAGRAMSSGDPAAASREFYDAGMVGEGSLIQEHQQRQEDRQLGMQKDQQALEHQQKAEKLEAMGKVAEALIQVPAGQRKATLDKILPAFERMGIPVDAFAGLTEDQLADASLQAFGAEVKSQLEIVKGGDGSYSVVNSQTGERLGGYQSPLAEEYKRAQIEATHARAGASSASAEAARARAERSRRPAAGGGGGGDLSGIEAELRRRGLRP